MQKGRSTHHAGGLAQKKSEELLGPDYESKFSKNHSKNKESNLPVSVVAMLASINRTSIYYKGTPISDEEFECKRIIDRLHTDNPTWGARQISSQLKQHGYKVGRRKARRYMDEMGINPVYPKPNLSKRLKQAQVVPYL